MVASLLTILAATQVARLTHAAPALFPEMFDSVSFGSKRVSIVSELVRPGQVGYQVVQEFVDLELGKQAYMVSNDDERKGVLVDGPGKVTYHYTPYTCKVTAADEPKLDEFDGLSGYVHFETGSGHVMDSYLYGVAGIWLSAAYHDKKYTRGSSIYSASSGQIIECVVWTYEDERLNRSVELNFRSPSGDKSEYSQTPTLEMITITMPDKSLVKINIMAIEYEFSADIASDLFEIPVGFDCPVASDSIGSETGDLPGLNDSDIWIPNLARSHLVQMELTATKYGSGENGDLARITDVVYVEMARIVKSSEQELSNVQLFRMRDKMQDIKTIINHSLNIEYTIDIRRKSCSITSKSADPTKLKETTNVNFRNSGLDLKLGSNMIRELFGKPRALHFVKRVKFSKNSTFKERIFFEKQTDNLFDDGLPVSVMRTYKYRGWGRMVPESMTIWVFNHLRSQIVRSYHFELINTKLLQSWSESTRIFDVSTECYLNNPDMKFGRDYSWFTISYALPSFQVDMLIDDEFELEDKFHETIFAELIDVMRAPRVELMFHENGIMLRALVLDMPPAQIFFDSVGEMRLLESESSGIFHELAPDVTHCADLCQLHQCKTMSYCLDSHECLLSSNRYDIETNGKGFDAKPDSTCRMFTLPEQLDNPKTLRLSRLISKFRFENYAEFQLPQVPEELTLPRSETGISESEYSSALREYSDKLDKFLATHDLPYLTLRIELDEHLIVLLPDKFELDADPLRDFKLIATKLDDDDDEDGSMFHQGISMHRYKINSFDQQHQRNSRLLSKLSYDFCASACADSKCGSFSYCAGRQECVLTSVNSIEYAKAKKLLEFDPACLIMTRDHLSSFHHFPSAKKPPAEYKSVSEAHGASECAFDCTNSDGYRCLSFDFCKRPNEEQGHCYLSEERQELIEVAPNSQDNICDHYEKNLLADFVRIEFTEIEPYILGDVKTTKYDDLTVRKCAEICARKLDDCGAFQFCSYPNLKNPLQFCTMIQSRLDGKQKDTRLVVNETGDDDIVTKRGEYFKTSENCVVFALREDTAEARARQLTIDVDMGPSREEKRPSSSLSIFACSVMLVVTGILSMATGYSFSLARDHTTSLNHFLGRLRSSIGQQA